MTPTLERILAQVETLSPEEKRELRDRLAAEPAPRERNTALIHELRGKYRDVLSSTEELFARKREEVELEERKFRR